MILIGLRYLHANDIIHRDLNPKNILVDILSPGIKILKITDFGLSKNAKIKKMESQSLANLTTPFYKAPEVFKGETPT
jgi:serine/threonine protein kinase